MERFRYMAVITVFPLLLFACGTSADSGSFDGAVTIKTGDYCQRIDGFGGSNAWTPLPSDTTAANEVVKLLYSKTEGAGFSILRNRIPFRERLSGDDTPSYNDGFVVRKDDNTYDCTVNEDGTKTFNLNWNSWDIAGTRNLIRLIYNLGGDGPEKLTVMSTPWTPPNNRVTRWKEDVSGVNEKLDYKIDWARPDIWGRLKRDKYDDYADLLADYVKNFEAKMGTPLAVLSLQNEPNWKVEYESAYLNGDDIRDFLKTIGRRFPMKGIILTDGKLGIMAPEYENFNIDFNAMIKPSLDDPLSENVLTHIALHQYNGAADPSSRAGAKEFPEITSSGKRFWQTEVSGSGQHLPAGTGIDNALYYARMIHQDMTLSQINAFLYWWLWTNGVNENIAGSLINVDGDTVTSALRLYTMGQYSRFIRPGWNRIACNTSPVGGVYSSAYKNPASGEIAVVLINERFTAASVSLILQDSEFENISLWRTSANEKLKSLGKQKVSRNTANVSLPPRSVSTFYGTLKNSK